MRQLLAVIQKEWLLLLRDKTGLLVLFVMPAVLVVVITLVQENALKAMGASSTHIVMIDNDGQALGAQIADSLAAAEGVVLTRELEGQPLERQAALEAVAKGRYQLCLILPAGLTDAVRQRARASARESLSIPPEKKASPAVPAIEIFFDPAVTGGLRTAVGNLLDLMLLRLEVAEKVAALGEALPKEINRSLRAELKDFSDYLPETPRLDLSLNWSPMELVTATEQELTSGGRALLPTSTQQNVPAWTLFGIFFIAVPMAGAFIRERINGTHQRLLTMPVGYAVLVCGRVCAYVVVCSVQCILIGCIGKWLLPLWGAPPLTIGGSPTALVLMAASAILAATGYGILLGTVVNSYEQASMFGPISIVIAAALGGIMVPVYAMPEFMQQISNLSPLAWGLTGTLDVFVRGEGLSAVAPEAGILVAFFLGCTLLAWGHQRYHRSRGRV